MAKPKHGRHNNHPSSIDAHHPSHDRTRPRPRPSPRAPSQAVLSALALIATSPRPVVGGPLPLPTPPPTFLCPSIADPHSPRSSPRLSFPPRALPASSSKPAPSPTPTSAHQLVADKYVEGSDSLWRKTDAWTLYGSTCCSSPTASTSAVPSQPDTYQASMPTSTLSSVEFDTSVLPAGWDNTNDISTTESTIILALAIVLAGLICVFMIGCLVWRKRKKKARDIERKLAHKLVADDDSQGNMQEVDARGKMRMWAKATARWKSSIRQSARRRRKRPMPSSNRSPSPAFVESPQLLTPTRSPLRPSSFVSSLSGPRALNGSVTEPLHGSPRSPSPPTYGASFVSGFSPLPPISAESNPSLASSFDGPRIVQQNPHHSCVEDEPIPYLPPSDGHIATDDKAQLARIQELASSPIMASLAHPSITQSVSAPEWHEVEDELEQLGVDLGQVPMSFTNFGFPPAFPPPPSKANILYDDLSLPCAEDGDIPAPLPPPGPSRPLFEAPPSAPPIDDPGLEPSAPSLEGEDDLFQDWDGAPSYVPERPTSADLDTTSARPKESDTSPTVSSTSHASSASTPEFVARDGTLPRYHP